MTHSMVTMTWRNSKHCTVENRHTLCSLILIWFPVRGRSISYCILSLVLCTCCASLTPLHGRVDLIISFQMCMLIFCSYFVCLVHVKSCYIWEQVWILVFLSKSKNGNEDHHQACVVPLD